MTAAILLKMKPNFKFNEYIQKKIMNQNFFCLHPKFYKKFLKSTPPKKVKTHGASVSATEYLSVISMKAALAATSALAYGKMRVALRCHRAK